MGVMTTKTFYEAVKQFYPTIYSKADVLQFKKAGLLTDEEYNQIVGESTVTV